MSYKELLGDVSQINKEGHNHYVSLFKNPFFTALKSNFY